MSEPVKHEGLLKAITTVIESRFPSPMRMSSMRAFVEQRQSVITDLYGAIIDGIDEAKMDGFRRGLEAAEENKDIVVHAVWGEKVGSVAGRAIRVALETQSQKVYFVHNERKVRVLVDDTVDKALARWTAVRI